ncbi:MAG: hypothetical protein WEB00_01360 [Dehalococcoidia bacterium]
MRITSGEQAGDTVELDQGSLGVGGEVRGYREGDEVLVNVSELPDGQNAFSIQDYVRRDDLVLLALAFVIAVLIVGARQGARSLVALAFTLLVLVNSPVAGMPDQIRRRKYAISYILSP